MGGNMKVYWVEILINIISEAKNKINLLNINFI